MPQNRHFFSLCSAEGLIQGTRYVPVPGSTKVGHALLSLGARSLMDDGHLQLLRQLSVLVEGMKQ